MEQKHKECHRYNQWYVPVLIIHYLPSVDISITVRDKYYKAEKGVIMSTDYPDKFKIWGLSANIDDHIRNIMCRDVWKVVPSVVKRIFLQLRRGCLQIQPH